MKQNAFFCLIFYCVIGQFAPVIHASSATEHEQSNFPKAKIRKRNTAIHSTLTPDEQLKKFPTKRMLGAFTIFFVVGASTASLWHCYEQYKIERNNFMQQDKKSDAHEPEKNTASAVKDAPTYKDIARITAKLFAKFLGLIGLAGIGLNLFIEYDRCPA